MLVFFKKSIKILLSIKKIMFLNFLHEFCKLSPSEQRVFLYCLEKKPYPRKKSDDLKSISLSLNLSYKTVWRAMSAINNNKALSQLVHYIKDVEPAKVIPYQDEVMLMGCLSDARQDDER